MRATRLVLPSQDDDRPVVALIDVYSGRPETASAGGKAPQPVPVRRCPMHYADYHFHQNRPGLRVLQTSWHPYSPAHFAVLASDNRWRLYNTKARALSLGQLYGLPFFSIHGWLWSSECTCDASVH